MTWVQGCPNFTLTRRGVFFRHCHDDLEVVLVDVERVEPPLIGGHALVLLDVRLRERQVAVIHARRLRAAVLKTKTCKEEVG